MNAKEFLQQQDDGYIPGDYTPNEVISMLEDYANIKCEEQKKLSIYSIKHLLEKCRDELCSVNSFGVRSYEIDEAVNGGGQKEERQELIDEINNFLNKNEE